MILPTVMPHWDMENPHTDATWSSNDPNGQVRWDSFVQYFNLRDLDGSSCSLSKENRFISYRIVIIKSPEAERVERILVSWPRYPVLAK